MNGKKIGILLAVGVLGIVSGCGKKDQAEDVKAEAAPSPEAETTTLEELDLEKHIKLGQYIGIRMVQKTVQVTEEEIESEIAARLSANPMEVPNGVAEEGDMVNISFVGTIDGEAFEGGSAENQDIVIGSKRLIEGFETGMVGMKTGETKVLHLTFPKDYNEELGGKDVDFSVTMNSVKRAPDTLTLEWIAANSEVKTVEEYRGLVKEELFSWKQEDADHEMRMAAWQQVVEGSEILEYPPFLLEEGEQMMKDELTGYAMSMGLELKDLLAAQEITEEQFEEQCEEFGKSIAAQKLVLQAIMKEQNWTKEDPEVKKMIEENAKAASMDVETYLMYAKDMAYETAALDRVCNLIVQNAVITAE